MDDFSPCQFASAVGISDRAARAAFCRAEQGKTWKGHRLPIARVPTARGGKAGEIWALDLSRADDALLKLVGRGRCGSELDRPVSCDPVASWRLEEQQDRHRIILPVLATAPRSRARGEAFADVATERHMYRGELREFSEPTLKRWVSDFEKLGLVGLLPKAPSNGGARRVVITRSWDQAAGLPPDDMARIAREVETYAASLVAKSMSLTRVQGLASKRLAELTRGAGSPLSDGALRKACKLNGRWAARFTTYRRVARRDLDNKAHFDSDVPRIARRRAAHPMDVVFGDVHPVDIFVKAADGKSQLRVRMIAWMDDHTHYLWATPAVLGKGYGIRQVDIADSLYALVRDPHGGFPRTLYLDNGSEYANLTETMNQFPGFNGLMGNRKVINAQAYNGPAKGIIEGAFGRLEQGVFKHIPGWIGGDRTNMKTQAVGKPVRAFDGTIEELAQAMREVVAIHNDTPQHSRLNGQSPRDALRAAIEGGWTSETVDDATFDLLVSRSDTRFVKQGKISFNNVFYYCDELAQMGSGDQVDIKVPLRSATDGITILHNGKILGQAFPDEQFDPQDRRGAVEKRRRAKLHNDAVSALKAKVDPSVDPHREQLRFTDTTPLATEHGTIVRLGDLGIDQVERETDEQCHARATEFLALLSGNEKDTGT